VPVDIPEGSAAGARKTKFGTFYIHTHTPHTAHSTHTHTHTGTCETKSGTFLGTTKFLKGGGRWAQACDLYTENTVDILQTALGGGT
jgi:hypothetical protein